MGVNVNKAGGWGKISEIFTEKYIDKSAAQEEFRISQRNKLYIDYTTV